MQALELVKTEPWFGTEHSGGAGAGGEAGRVGSPALTPSEARISRLGPGCPESHVVTPALVQHRTAPAASLLRHLLHFPD